MIELVFPFFTLIPHRMAGMFNGAWQIIFQLVLISTGNLSFLNWLTIAPSIWFFDDKFISRFFTQSTLDKLPVSKIKTGAKQEPSKPRQLLHLIIGCLIVYLSVPIVIILASPNQAMNRSFDPFRIVNTYGAFGR